MPDAYQTHDGIFAQFRTRTSAANALLTYVGPVPEGKVWTILGALGNCSVSETQVYWFSVYGQGDYFPITTPTSVVVDPATQRYIPCVREGMEIKLFPGEYLYLHRASNTAGSTITISARIIETDLPFYTELDKHKELRRKQSSPLQFLRSRAASSSARAGTATGREGGGGGGRGELR